MWGGKEEEEEDNDKPNEDTTRKEAWVRKDGQRRDQQHGPAKKQKKRMEGERGMQLLTHRLNNN